MTWAPSAQVAERALVGGLISDPARIVEVIGVLDPPQCFDPRHEHLLALLYRMHKAMEPIDLISVAHVTVQRPGLYGDPGYVAGLPEYAPSTTNMRHYAELVAAAAQRRKLLDVASEIQDLARERDRDVSEILAEARALVAAVVPPSRGHARRYGDVVNHAISEAEASYNGRILRIPTPFRDLNDLLAGGGFRRGHVVVVGARPSMGKSAFVLNILEGMAAAGTPVAVFSLEMDEEELGGRALSGATGVRMDRIANPSSWDHALQDGRNVWDHVVDAQTRLADLPLWVDTRSGLTWAAIEAEIERLVQEHGVEVFAIDYLQLLPVKSLGHKGDEIGETIKRSKVLAKRLGIVLIWLSQLNRGLESRESKVPHNADLRDTGEIEQVADVILFLHRPHYFDKAEDPRKVVIPCTKQRGGRIGTVYLQWFGEVQRFQDEPTMEERQKEAARRKQMAEVEAKQAAEGKGRKPEPQDDSHRQTTIK